MEKLVATRLNLILVLLANQNLGIFIDNFKPISGFVLHSGCSDNDTSCVEWAKSGECEKNAEWMKENCMKSCEQC